MEILNGLTKSTEHPRRFLQSKVARNYGPLSRPRPPAAFFSGA